MANTLVERDTAPIVSAVISDTNGVLNLTGSTVYFQLRLANEKRFRIDAECDITGPTVGEVEYTIAAGDLDFSGDCLARFLVVYPDGVRQHTVPALSITVSAQ